MRTRTAALDSGAFVMYLPRLKLNQPSVRQRSKERGREWSQNVNRGSLSRCAVDPEMSGNVVRAFMHPSNAKSCRIARNDEPHSVVFNNHLHRGPSIHKCDGQSRTKRMANRISNRLVTDPQQCV